jgi:FKBP-type peptidyl-prolyl cis-trans isomerase FkpA
VSVAEAAHRPAKSGRSAALWLAFQLIIAAGLGLAWRGAGSLRPEITSSGLQFRAIKEGTGEPMMAADAALMDYVLTLDDGTVFDSSEKHGGPQPFAMGMVFPGFAEAMTKMREGGRYRFTMPQRLAFPTGTPAGFPPNTNLTFEVQVRKIVRGGAAMMQQQAAPQPPPQPQQ